MVVQPSVDALGISGASSGLGEGIAVLKLKKS
jgi:hypothetical protein